MFFLFQAWVGQIFPRNDYALGFRRFNYGRNEIVDVLRQGAVELR